MGRFVALYRGINVGGRNTVKMEVLRAMHAGLGHRDVASYIQSGNIVFSANGSAAVIARKIAGQFPEEFGFAAHVLVVPEAGWDAMRRDNPYLRFCAQEPKTVHVSVCDGVPNEEGLKALLERTAGNEAFVIQGEIIYLRTPDGLGKSKFAAGMERACGVPITMRNWRTVEALGAMLGASAG